MTTLLQRLSEDDPEYDPVANACEAAGIPRDLFSAALNRVYYDGHYGPVSPQSWLASHDGEEHAEAVADTADALEVLERVSDEIEGYCEAQLGLDDAGDEVEWTEETVSADEIRREVLQVLYYLYGRLPW